MPSILRRRYLWLWNTMHDEEEEDAFQRCWNRSKIVTCWQPKQGAILNDFIRVTLQAWQPGTVMGDSGWALLRDTGAFTSDIHSVIRLSQPRRSQQWGRMGAAYQRRSLAWRLLVGAFRLNLKARPWSKRITAFYVRVDHGSKLERCLLWWLVCLWTWRVELPSTPVHVCTRMHMHRELSDFFVIHMAS